MKNVSILKDIVKTQYNDMEGLISIDTHEGSNIFELCRDNGINMEHYFLIGFGLSEFTLDGIRRGDNVYCSVLLLDKSKYGDSFDNISNKIRSLDCVDVEKKTFTIKYTDLGKYIKRFDFLAVSDISSYIKNMNLSE